MASWRATMTMTRRRFLRAISAALLTPWLGALAAASRAEDAPSGAAPGRSAGPPEVEVEGAAAERRLRRALRAGHRAPIHEPAQRGEAPRRLRVRSLLSSRSSRSDAKYDSGTGWPSFFRALPGRVGTERDFAAPARAPSTTASAAAGTRATCSTTGPPPTGLRYCNNGVALRFVPEGEPLPPLRTAP